MKLNLLNNLFNGFKEDKSIQNFINELSDSLKNDEIEKLPIIEEILTKNNVGTGNENSIRIKEREIIIDYANKKYNNEIMYFVKDGKKEYWLHNEKHYNNDVFNVFKVEDGKIEEMEINKKDIPGNINVNDVFKIENNNYIVDNESTQELQDAIVKMAEEIIGKQNVNLNKHRKEGHLYIVTEELGNKRFLRDLTEESNVEFEENNISEDLLERATEGIILKYENGKYEFYSDNRYEMF